MLWFSEWKEKENLEDDINKDTIEFSFRNTFIFDETMTLPLTGDEIITMPHMAIIVRKTNYSKPFKRIKITIVNKFRNVVDGVLCRSKCV